MGELTLISALKPFMKEVNVKFIVLERMSLKKSAKGNSIYTFLVADESGSIELVLWDEIGASVDSGDILILVNGYTTLFQKILRLYTLNNASTVTRIGEFNILFSESPNMSKIAWNVSFSKGNMNKIP